MREGNFIVAISEFLSSRWKSYNSCLYIEYFKEQKISVEKYTGETECHDVAVHIVIGKLTVGLIKAA